MSVSLDNAREILFIVIKIYDMCENIDDDYNYNEDFKFRQKGSKVDE